MTGIHLGHFGRGTTPRVTVADAVRETLAAPGCERVRLSSIEAMELGECFVRHGDPSTIRAGPAGPRPGSIPPAARLGG